MRGESGRGSIAHSVFTKLIVILAAAGVLINLAVLGFFASAFHKSENHPFGYDIVRYARHLANEIGLPPDPDKAREVARDSLFQIAYEGPDSSWSTGDGKLLHRGMEFRQFREDSDVKVGRFRGSDVFKLQHGAGSLVFVASFPFGRERGGGGSLVVLLLMLTGILACTWLILQEILKPLKSLSTAVEQVSGGNLEHRVPESGKDELGDLASAFNTMTARISHMLKARERLLLDVSHELRSPLTRINVALEFLPKGKTKDAVKADVCEMELMITEILESERLKNVGKDLILQEVDMAGLVRDTADQFREQGHGIVPLRMEEDAKCGADRELASLVVKNLLSNALKYSDAERHPVEVSVERETGWVVIRIRDYGEGIPAEDQPHIFEPFYRVEKSRSRGTGGYGLGLSLCKAIMDTHGGNIEVESAPGKGTEVKLSFQAEEQIPERRT